MKNIYYILLLAFAALLAGCERHSVNTDEDVYPDTYIFLDAKVVKTKATLYDEETLPNNQNTSFGVFGVREDGQTPVFDNYTADENSPFDDVAVLYRPERPSGSGSNRVPSDFIYDCLALWDSGENSFYAYYINGSEYHREFDETEFNGFCTSTRNVISDVGVRRTSSKVYMEYNQPNTLETMVDVMTAKTTTTQCDVVGLDFEHRLFAIDVVVRNYQIKDDKNPAQAFTFSNPTITFRVPNGGDLYFDDENSNTLNTDSLDVTYTFTPAEGTSFTIEAPSGSKERDFNLNRTIETNSAGRPVDNPFLFLPCESLRVLDFSLTFDNSWGVSSTTHNSWKIAPEGGFKPGHRYQFIIKKNHFGSEFEFEPQIAVLEYDENGNIVSDGNWNDKDDVDHTFN